ncbi:MAG TPA: DegT/DnrJ/EryC1/StrS family aminotransferase, partial [Acidimicrobiales bacterium]|nr:DegT/DnrJ/EryC1/StrS family aminotransferase [Acidimicrobiales bacterium]
LGSRYAVATSSGTAALRCGLAALGVGCGDEVIVPAFTFIATVNAVVVSGAVPVFAEIDETLGLDPHDVDTLISPRTAAVIPVHLENGACDMAPLLEVCRRRGVPVLEDAAQAMGVTYHGRSLGTLGDMGAFSLQLEKNATSGEGGLLVSDDERLWLRAARYQDQGGQFVTSLGDERGSEPLEPFVGENLRMAELAGAMAEVQLGRLPALLAAQRANRDRILAAIGGVAGLRELERRRLPDPQGDGGSSLSFFLPDAEQAKRFARSLLAEGIPAGQLYRGRPVYATPSILERRTASGKGGPWNCAQHPTEVAYRIGMCPRTEALAARSLLVVVAAAWSPEDCDAVVEALAKVHRALLGA